MTTNHRFFKNLEIVFWDTTIPALTNVRKLRQTIYYCYTMLSRTVPKRALKRVIMQSFVWSAIGLIFGLLLGLLSASL